MTRFLTDYGIYAVFVAMAVDAVFPAFSELVMLYGGALASGALTQTLDVFGTHRAGLGAYLAIALSGTLGYFTGALVGWWLGSYLGHSFFVRHGKWFHLDRERLERADRWFDRFELWAVLVGRITPIARSFISIPAGIFETPLGRYVVLTLIGSAAWAFAWAGAGWAVGSSWQSVDHGFRYVEYGIVAVVLLGAAYLLLRRRRSSTMANRATDPPR